MFINVINCLINVFGNGPFAMGCGPWEALSAPPTLLFDTASHAVTEVGKLLSK